MSRYNLDTSYRALTKSWRVLVTSQSLAVTEHCLPLSQAFFCSGLERFELSSRLSVFAAAAAFPRWPKPFRSLTDCSALSTLVMAVYILSY